MMMIVFAEIYAIFYVSYRDPKEYEKSKKSSKIDIRKIKLGLESKFRMLVIFAR